MKSPRQRRTPPRLPSARVEAEREAAVQAFIERQIEQRRRLSELAVGISAEAALEGLLEKVPRIAKEVIGAEMAALVFLEEGGMGVEHFSYSVPDRSLFPDHPPEGKGLLGFVFQESQAVRVENVTQHPHYGGLFKDMPHPPMKAFLGVPLRAEDGATLGAVYVANGSMGPAFSEQDQELLTVLGEYISTALERIRQQKRLQASEAKARALERRYRTLLEKANDAVFISRARDGRFVEVNRRAVELTGYSAEELLKMKVWDLRSKEHHSLLRQRLAKIVEKGSGSAVYDDLPLLRKNGTKLEVLVSTTLAEVEGELLFEAIVRDVTQERQYQRELEKLYGETVEQQRLTAALNRISQTLNSTLDYRQVLATICWDCLELMQISGVYIWVVEGEEIVLKVVHLADREGLERGEIRRPLREDSRVIASRVAATGKAEIVNNVPEVPPGKIDPEMAEISDAKAVLCVPLLQRDECVGVLGIVDSANPQRFSQRDVEMASAFASHAVTALENARLYQEALEQQQLAAALNRISQTLSSTLDYRQVLATICRECLDLTQVSRVNIWVVEGREVVRKAGWAAGRVKPDEEEIRQPLRKDSPLVTSRVVLTGKGEIVNNILEAPPGRVRIEIVRRMSARSLMVVPLLKEGRCLGTLTLVDVKNPQRFSEKDMEVASAFASHAVTGLENASLYQEARTLEQRYRTLLENASDAVFISRARDGRFVEVNRRAVELTGYPVKELLKMKVWDLRPKEHHSLLQQRLAEIVEKGSGSAVYDDVPLLRKDGTRIEVLVSVTLVEVEGEPFFEAIVRDVTEEKRHQREMEKLYREVQNKADRLAILGQMAREVSSRLEMGQLFARLEESIAKVIPCDNAAVFFYDWETDVLTLKYTIGTGIPRKPGSHLSRPRPLFDQVLETGKSILVADVGKLKVAKGGSWREAGFRSMIAMPITLDETVMGTLLLANRQPNQFTPQHLEAAEELASHLAVALKNAQLFEGLNQALQELEAMQAQLIQAEKLSAVGELVAGVAHELNNPLTSVLGFSQLLLDSQLDPEVRQDVEKIAQEAQRAVTVVQNLLSFARKEEPRKAPSDLNQLLSTALELRGNDLALNNIKVVTRLDLALPTVVVDPHQIRAVFLNLVSNATYFMSNAHGGGTLKVTTETGEGVVRVLFADDGPGIAPEHLSRVFDPFFTTKDVGEGTGLGLSLSHGIITGHQGRIWVESTLGKGASFIIELPLGTETPEQWAADRLPSGG